MATLRARALGVVAAVLLGVVLATPAHAQQCGPMDVTFIIDETGSMTDVINQVQTQVQKIADAVQVASGGDFQRSEEHTSELQSLRHLVCRLLLEKKKKKKT